jgi:hypothetical protein
MRRFRWLFCGRSSARSASLARKSGRFYGYLTFGQRWESRWAATTLLESAFTAGIVNVPMPTL